MRVAIQLHGHLRTFQKCARSLGEYVFRNADKDIFIHTWDHTEHGSKSWYPEEFRDSPRFVSLEVRRDIERLYKPKKLKIERQPIFAEEGYFGSHDGVRISLNGIKHSLYSQFQANELRREYEKDNGVSYDLVLVTRPDVEFLEAIDEKPFRRAIEFYDKTLAHLVHFHEIQLRERQIITYPQMIDVAYIGKPSTVNEAAAMFKEFDRYQKDFCRTLPSGVEIPELAWKQYLTERSIVSLSFRWGTAIRRTLGKGDIVLLPKSLNYIELDNILDETMTETQSTSGRKELSRINLKVKRGARMLTKFILRTLNGLFPNKLSGVLMSLGNMAIKAASYVAQKGSNVK